MSAVAAFKETKTPDIKTIRNLMAAGDAVGSLRAIGALLTERFEGTRFFTNHKTELSLAFKTAGMSAAESERYKIQEQDRGRYIAPARLIPEIRDYIYGYLAPALGITDIEDKFCTPTKVGYRALHVNLPWELQIQPEEMQAAYSDTHERYKKGLDSESLRETHDRAARACGIHRMEGVPYPELPQGRLTEIRPVADLAIDLV